MLNMFFSMRAYNLVEMHTNVCQFLELKGFCFITFN